LRKGRWRRKGVAQEYRRGHPSFLVRLPRYLRLTVNLYRDWRVKPWTKAKLLLAMGYSLSPLDLLPGFLPVVGQLDDAYVVLGAVKGALQELPPIARQEHLVWAGVSLEELEGDLAQLRFYGRVLSAGGWRVAKKGLKWLGRSGLVTVRHVSRFLQGKRS